MYSTQSKVLRKVPRRYYVLLVSLLLFIWKIIANIDYIPPFIQSTVANAVDWKFDDRYLKIENS